MFEYTSYFEKDVLSKRPYIKKEWCEKVVSSKEFVEKQPDDRFRFWGKIPEFDNKYLRVITLKDQRIIHNAFFDRKFKEVK
ncbi:MAG: hypothetical protein K8F52_07300 [Candidatus Scalindua rubra]|uniref:Uncharacterized protein n=1 Tax=Candidatus Scalindua brodae TaxID=237368 RepID=A0A0B0EGB1_9BACT|nr:MAG: hypothetical protein SCABRO_02674 [Candidatus Scalindua brodae]MBZ0108460.1 hypothetical protein [Candidatus Scalindua rubra]TWU30918.1 hypothetical protein S225a_23610 [Candidatus Brocadiaceae bacterium S225]